MGGRAYKGLWPLEFVDLEKVVQLRCGHFCSISVSVQQLMLSLKSVLLLARQGDSWSKKWDSQSHPSNGHRLLGVCWGGSSLVPEEGPVSAVTGGSSSYAPLQI